MRLRKRAAALAVGAAVLFLLGTNVEAGWLFVLCALMLGTVLAGVILPRRMLQGIEVERRPAEEVVQGDETSVELIVTNRARGVRLGLRLDDPHLAPVSLYLTKILPGERVELDTLRIAAKRGVHEGSVVVVRSVAPFGVAERRRKLPVAGSTTVLPAVLPLEHLPFLGRGSDPQRTARSTTRRGGGPEYLGVREYQPGDSARHVHWPSTARTGTIMVRELEEERSRRLALLVDTLTDVGDTGTPLDTCCTAAASIARAAVAEGHGIRSIVAAGRNDVEVADDVEEIAFRRRLAALEPDGTTFATLVGRAGDALVDVDLAVLVFPTWRSNGDGPLAKLVEELAETHVRVVALMVEVDPGLAKRVATLRTEEIADLASKLTVAGADVYVWSPGSSLGSVLGREPAVVA